MNQTHDTVQFLDATVYFAVHEVVQMTGLSDLEVTELCDRGLLPAGPGGRLPAQVIAAGRRAARLRDAFELDVAGMALAVSLLSRIEELEARLDELACHLPR